MAGESKEARLKRMQLRSMRRGIKEMDLILGAFARDRLGSLSEPELLLYDALLSENDQDLYSWMTGREPTPERFSSMMSMISEHAMAK